MILAEDLMHLMHLMQLLLRRKLLRFIVMQNLRLLKSKVIQMWSIFMTETKEIEAEKREGIEIETVIGKETEKGPHPERIYSETDGAREVTAEKGTEKGLGAENEKGEGVGTENVRKEIWREIEETGTDRD